MSQSSPCQGYTKKWHRGQFDRRISHPTHLLHLGEPGMRCCRMYDKCRHNTHTWVRRYLQIPARMKPLTTRSVASLKGFGSCDHHTCRPRTIRLNSVKACSPVHWTCSLGAVRPYSWQGLKPGLRRRLINGAALETEAGVATLECDAMCLRVRQPLPVSWRVSVTTVGHHQDSPAERPDS